MKVNKKVNFKNRKRAYDLITQAAKVYEDDLKETARDYLYKALKYFPDCEEAFFNLCIIEYKLFNWEKSLENGANYFRVTKEPVGILASYAADAANRFNKFDEAIKWCKVYICLCPHDPVCYNTMGVVLFKKHNLLLALTQYSRCLTLQPGMEQPLNNLGLAYKAVGDYKKCTEYALEMAKINKDQSDVYKNLLTSYLYHPSIPVEDLAKAQQGWIDTFVKKDINLGEIKSDYDANKPKLRVAIVSSDLYAHPVGRNFLAFYLNTDPNQIEYLCYTNTPKEDQITDCYKQRAVKYTKIHGYTDDQVARMIREDKCDIAIFLCPFFDSNRPLIAAYRAAPVQISYLDAGRTIIPNMDYLVIGRHFAPRHIRDIGVERIIGMPRFYQHPFLDDAPKPNELPALKNGFMTFAVHNNPAKINEEVLELWGEIAKKCKCKFHFKYKGLWANKWLQDKALKYIPEDQCIFAVGNSVYQDHLLAYHNTDLQLDTFSFVGSTTTFESLSMGVPVITLAGDTLMFNYGAGILTQCKLTEFITRSKEEYVALALKFANNPELLIEYRKNIRDNNVKENVCTVKPYFFVKTLRTLWRKTCKEKLNGSK